MKAKQAKMAVETAKEVANDKTLRNKAEKERRLREKNQNNTKKFIEERKITAMKQNKEKEKLLAAHAKQLEDLNRDIQLVCMNYYSFSNSYYLTAVFLSRTLKCIRTLKWNTSWRNAGSFSSKSE